MQQVGATTARCDFLAVVPRYVHSVPANRRPTFRAPWYVIDSRLNDETTKTLASNLGDGQAVPSFLLLSEVVQDRATLQSLNLARSLDYLTKAHSKNSLPGYITNSRFASTSR
jgi:hypothetical protein